VTSRDDTRSVLLRAQAAFPGGVLGSFALGDLEFVAHHGAGATLVATDGREFIDCVLGSGPLILGHAHPAVASAIAAQAQRGTTFYTLNEPAIQLAEQILAVFPTDSRLMFTSSGAEATFYALRLARAFTGRDLIIKFAGAYHGHHDYAMVETWARDWTPSVAPAVGSAGIPRAAAETVLIAPFNDLDATAALFAAHSGQIAAVIVEPYQRVVQPEHGFLAGLRDLAHANGALLIADEVVTGFRLQYGTAQNAYGFTADLTALGKVIGGGLPLAAVAGRSDVLAQADYRRNKTAAYVYVSGTLNGNALAAAAGSATLAELAKPGTYDVLNGVGEQVRSRLSSVLKAAGFDAIAAGEGPMFHPVFRRDAPRNAAEVAAARRELGVQFGKALIRNGVLVNPAQRSYLSTAHTGEVIERLGSALEAAANELAAELAAVGA
jgi:glutamate-1-semialdehyde 2,1-aminomutase